MRGLRNRLSAIYQIATLALRHSGKGRDEMADALRLIQGLADGTIQPQKALAEWRAVR